ncbi:MAG TPA: hypothetical protein VFM99_02300, partial [Chitinophagales bacterium]|nr:hypothetical protein [Chitinophagales bacterium]
LDQLNPKLIIYEINPGVLSEDGVESALDIIANDKNDIYSIQMALKLNHAKVYNTLMYGLMQDIFNLNNSFVEAYKSGDDEYIRGGFVQRKISYYSPTTELKSTTEFNEKQLSSFKTIVNMIKERNIPLIFVFVPIPTSTFNQYSNNADFDSIIESYSTYYNFNEIIQLDDSLDFYDFQHLNQNGVEIFNKKLLEILQNN